MLKTFIFDFDGTLADTFELNLQIVNLWAKKYGYIPVQIDELDSLRTKTIRQIFAERHIPILKLPFIVRDIRSSMIDKIPEIKPFDGLATVLAELKQREISLCVITSNSTENVEAFLKNNGIQFFKHIYSAKDTFGKDKVISKFMKQFGIDPQEAVYVGDEVRDIEAAHKAGIKIASVTWGYNAESILKTYQPDYLIRKPQELISIIE